MANVSRIPRLTLAVTAIILTLATLAAGVTAPPAPADQSWRVGYLSRVDKSGHALYVTADRRLSVTVDANGVVATPTNRPPSTDCYGKTLDELRSNGRLMEPQRAK